MIKTYNYFQAEKDNLMLEVEMAIRKKDLRTPYKQHYTRGYLDYSRYELEYPPKAATLSYVGTSY